jgi:glycolate oxidase
MIEFPAPDPKTIARRGGIAAALAQIVPDGVVADIPTLRAYDRDALTAYGQLPLVCVLPATADQVCQILKFAGSEGLRIVPRGAGTSLSGGAMPLADGILLGLSRMNRILDIDYDNGCVVVQPGVTNAAVTRAVQAKGYYYAPDPSSQIACTIGGNVAENSGGIHCLKYGLTTHNLLGIELALIDGERLRLGGKFASGGGLDLLSVACGSEGLLGVVTEATLRILPRPPVTRTVLLGFASAADAGHVVADIIAAGIIPAALEFMDRRCIDAVEDFCAPGYPANAEAILIAELDGMASEVADQLSSVTEIATRHGATAIRDCSGEAERARVWSGRKSAFGAMGRLKPDMLCMDGTIPRAALPDMLDRISALSAQYGLICCNVFHAGDGNLHPLIVFDCMRDGELERAEAFGSDILKLCVEMGGVLTGEHGVGVEKKALMPQMFSDIELAQQQKLKCAFDPNSQLNPGKVFPVLHACVELGHMHVRDGRMPFANLPRM